MWREQTNLLHDEVNLLNSKKAQLTGEVESARTQNSILEETRNELNTQIYLLEKQMDSLKINTQILNDKHDELWVICQEQQTNRDNLDTEVDCLRVKRSACENDIASLTATRDGLLASIEQIHRQIDENTELYYQNAMSAM
jgi:chromosome segregation ATPase